jgi:hypothetical protein
MARNGALVCHQHRDCRGLVIDETLVRARISE